MYKQDLAFTNTIAEDSDFTSEWFWTGEATLLNLQVGYEADTAIAGAWTLECSDARMGTAQDDITPSDTIEDSEFVISDESGSRTWNVSEVGFNWVRAKFAFDTASPEQVVQGRLVLKGPATN